MFTLRRPQRTFLAVSAAVLLLAACGGNSDDGDTASSGGSGADSGSSGSLLVWAGEGTGGDAVKKIAAGFGSENKVDVKVELLPGDKLQSSFVTASQAGKAPDVVFGAHDWIGNMVQNGAIDPIQLPANVSDTLQPLAVKATSFDGQVYGMPFTMNNVVLYRNTDLAPDAPKTIEDLVAASKALKSAGKADELLAYPVGATGNPYFIQALYTSGGGYIFGSSDSGDFDPKDLGVGKPESIAAYDKIEALGEKGEGALKRSVSADNALNLFTSKKTAFLVEGPWQLPNLAKADVKYDVSPIPGFAGGKQASPFITVDAAYVAAKGKNKTLAQEFVTNYWSRPDVQLSYFKASQAVPASKDVLTKIESSDPLVVAIAKIGAEQGQIMPSIPEMAAVWDPLGKAEAAVISGKDPQSTITAAGTTIEKAIK